MSDQSLIQDLEKDPPLDLSGPYVPTRNDRRYLDNQTQALAEHMFGSAILETSCNWYFINDTIADAPELVTSDCVCVVPFAGSGKTITKATPEALAQAGACLGVVVQGGKPGARAKVATGPWIPASVTGVSPDDVAFVIVNENARLARVESVGPGDFGYGTADLAGNVTLQGGGTASADAVTSLNGQVTGLVGATVIPPGGANTVLMGDGTNTNSIWAKITNANVDSAAAIAGTKVSPNFGAQNVVTTGTLGAGATTVTGLTVSGLGTGIVHSSSGGAFTSSLIVNADITDGTITLAKIAQSGATSGQVPSWNGSAWVASSISGAGGVPSTRQVIAGAGLTGGGALSTDVTLNVIANADGSIVVNANDVQVGVLATDGQHGNRGGGALHAAVTNGAAGFAPAISAANRVLLSTNGTSSAWGQVDLATMVTGVLSAANLPTSASALQLVANMPALEALPTGSLSDVCLCVVQSPRRLYTLEKTKTPGASGDDLIPPANPSGRWDFVMAL